MIDILRNNIPCLRISYKRADWANFRECDDIVKGGEVIWKSSPYDAATTAYLKATYGAYWNEIKAFGRSHPNLVPFINEDNDLIVSLVEVGKTRYVNNGGSSKFVFNSAINPNNTYRIKGRYNSVTGENCIFGAGNLELYASTSYDYVLRLWTNKGTRSTFDARQLFVAEINYANSLFVVNGEEYHDIGTTSLGSVHYLFDLNGGGTYKSNANIAEFSNDDINGNVVNRYLPFKRNGQMELLDIVTGTLATRVGTFTELIE